MTRAAFSGFHATSSPHSLLKQTLLAGAVLCIATMISGALSEPAVAQIVTTYDPDQLPADQPLTAGFNANGRPLEDIGTAAANGLPLDDVGTAVAPPLLLDSEEINGQRIPPPLGSERVMPEGRENVAEASVDQRARAAPEADPFAAQGIHVGSFILRPTLEQGIRGTSNADNSASGRSATLSETTLRLNAQSDWARHQATLNASGTWLKTLSGQNISDPQALIDGNLRLDITDQTQLNVGASYDVRRESASDPNASGAATRPLVHNSAAQIGLERDFNTIFARATARAIHTKYGDAKLANGDALNQSERDNSYLSMTLRGGFALSHAIRPFAEIEAGRRLYTHHNGFDRNATQLGLRTGLMLDMGEKLNGEFSAGYLRANSDDDRLRGTGGLSLDAAMNWSPQRGTDVALGLRTFVEGNTEFGGNSSLLYLANLDVSRMIRSNLSLNARLDGTVRDNRDGSGKDYGLGAEIGATYWFNRFFGLDAKYRHELMRSDVASRRYNSDSIYLGVKLQR